MRISLNGLQTNEQFIKGGITPYAVFTGTIPAETAGQPAIPVVVGLSHGMLERYGISKALISVMPISGCSVDTKVYINNLRPEDGEQDPEDQVWKFVDGEAGIILLGSISADFNRSPAFIEAQTDYSVKADALAQVETRKQQRLAAQQRTAQLMGARNLAGAPARTTTAVEDVVNNLGNEGVENQAAADLSGGAGISRRRGRANNAALPTDQTNLPSINTTTAAAETVAEGAAAEGGNAESGKKDK